MGAGGAWVKTEDVPCLSSSGCAVMVLMWLVRSGHRADSIVLGGLAQLSHVEGTKCRGKLLCGW